jgi:hypothetical protein
MQPHFLLGVLFLAVAPALARGGASYVARDGAAWSTDFASADGVFLADDGAVSHCPQCVYEAASHVSYGAGGVRLLLDTSPCSLNASACCDASGDGQCARVAAGHMRSAAFQSFGRFTFVARPAFPPGGGGGAPPSNSFTCLTTSYLGAPHHEVASCFHGSDPTEVSLAYWSEATGPGGVVLPVRTGVPLHDAFHEYAIEWNATYLGLSLDGKLIANASAAPNTTIPWRPGQALLINRFFDGAFEGSAVVALQSARYEPAA